MVDNPETTKPPAGHQDFPVLDSVPEGFEHYTDKPRISVVKQATPQQQPRTPVPPAPAPQPQPDLPENLSLFEQMIARYKLEGEQLERTRSFLEALNTPYLNFTAPPKSPSFPFDTVDILFAASQNMSVYQTEPSFVAFKSHTGFIKAEEGALTFIQPSQGQQSFTARDAYNLAALAMHNKDMLPPNQIQLDGSKHQKQMIQAAIDKINETLAPEARLQIQKRVAPLAAFPDFSAYIGAIEQSIAPQPAPTPAATAPAALPTPAPPETPPATPEQAAAEDEARRIEAEWAQALAEVSANDPVLNRKAMYENHIEQNFGDEDFSQEIGKTELSEIPVFQASVKVGYGEKTSDVQFIRVNGKTEVIKFEDVLGDAVLAYESPDYKLASAPAEKLDSQIANLPSQEIADAAQDQQIPVDHEPTDFAEETDDPVLASKRNFEDFIDRNFDQLNFYWEVGKTETGETVYQTPINVGLYDAPLIQQVQFTHVNGKAEVIKFDGLVSYESPDHKLATATPKEPESQNQAQFDNATHGPQEPKKLPAAAQATWPKMPVLEPTT